jgi:hypothetical protein
MSDWVTKHSVQSAQDGCRDAEADPDYVGGAIIISMGAAGISGFVVGLLCGGAFAFAGIALLLAIFSGFAGWWVRGVVR